MTVYGTWNLNFSENVNSGTGPEEAIRLQGIEIYPVWSIGMPENGGLIVGKLSAIPENLEAWNFTEISKEEAASLIESTFIYTPEDTDRGIKEYTLNMALENLDQENNDKRQKP